MNALQALKTILGLGGPSWRAWCSLIGGAFGCPLPADMAATFRNLTARDPLVGPARELWLAVGRRGGKNRAAAAVAVYLALFKKWTLAPGEVGTVLVLASDRTQARVAFRYILGLLESNPLLWQEVANVTADTITLRNGIEITIATADNAAVRGRTVVTCLCDEFAYWAYEQAIEVLRALRPGMATQPDAMLIVISSVYAAQGPFYEARRAYYGTDDPHVLYAVATSQQMNPTLPDEFIAGEVERDPTSAAAEYLCQERTDRETFIGGPDVDSNTRSEPRELPPLAVLPSGGHVQYVAAIDVSGGRSDAAACAIAHREGQRVIVDVVRREPSPHDPKAVSTRFAALLATHRLSHAIADNYAAEFSRSVYASAGITLTDAGVTRSEAYLHLLPLLTTGRVELPPDPRLRQELLGLERRTSRSGRDSVDHRPGAHDDLANAVALACWAASRRPSHAQRMVHADYSTLFDGMAGPVAQERMHPGDRRIDDPVAIHLQHERDLF
jgi:hypothetical protein